ncbi:MAG: GGDEF domain-containing protein [Bacilli bacterium]
MTKEQFNILLKAKHIISEQAQDALLYLQSCEANEAVLGHLSFYRSAVDEQNYKIGGLIAKSVAKYLPLIDDKTYKGIIYLILASEAMIHEQYGEVIHLYQLFISLECPDQKITINFDMFMFHIFSEYKLYEKYRYFAERIMLNPYIYQISMVDVTSFYLSYALFCFENKDETSMNKCYLKMKNLIDGNFNEETRDIGRHAKQLVYMLIELLGVKKAEEENQILSHYKQISYEYPEYPIGTIHYHYEIDYYMLKRLLYYKEWNYVAKRSSFILKKTTSIRMKVYFQGLKTQALKELKEKTYFSNLERLGKMQTKYAKELSSSIKDAYMAILKTIDLQKGFTKLQKLYERDELTQAYSRNILYQRAQDIFARNKTATVMFIDINYLKDVNDQHSHQTGDEYLKKFVQLVNNIFPRDAQLFRYGGDEFVILLPGDDEKNTNKLLDQMQKIFSIPQQILSEKILIRYSVGVAYYPRHGRDLQEVLSSADCKMYEAKRMNLGQCTSRSK